MPTLSIDFFSQNDITAVVLTSEIALKINKNDVSTYIALDSKYKVHGQKAIIITLVNGSVCTRIFICEYRTQAALLGVKRLTVPSHPDGYPVYCWLNRSIF